MTAVRQTYRFSAETCSQKSAPAFLAAQKSPHIVQVDRQIELVGKIHVMDGDDRHPRCMESIQYVGEICLHGNIQAGHRFVQWADSITVMVQGGCAATWDVNSIPDVLEQLAAYGLGVPKVAEIHQGLIPIGFLDQEEPALRSHQDLLRILRKGREYQDGIAADR